MTLPGHITEGENQHRFRALTAQFASADRTAALWQLSENIKNSANPLSVKQSPLLFTLYLSSEAEQNGWNHSPRDNKWNVVRQVKERTPAGKSAAISFIPPIQPDLCGHRRRLNLQNDSQDRHGRVLHPTGIMCWPGFAFSVIFTQIIQYFSFLIFWELYLMPSNRTAWIKGD